MISIKRTVRLSSVGWMLLISWAVCGANSGPTASNEVPSDPPTQILLIGNSLTFFNDMPEILLGLLNSVPDTEFLVEAVTIPASGLEDHWTNRTALRRIAEGGWDIVVLQQGPSATEGRPSLLEYSQLFSEKIRAVGATPAMYMVWPSVQRSFDADGVSDSYTTAAKLIGGGLLPAGDAFRVAQGMDPSIELYGGDGFHPSVEGSYLAALVMFVQMTGKAPDGLPTLIQTSSGPKEVAVRDAVILQQAALETSLRVDVSCVLWSNVGCREP